MVSDKLHFRANVRLKDLLGRGLILSDNVAIIELIKNSSDANSKEVRIEFENANAPSPNSKILIRDFGDGMSFLDFKEKWLNIAYSGKRNQLNKGRSYAGEKGVGRFSCDRLGQTLHLISRKKGSKPFEAKINWSDFEVDDIDAEISNVDIESREIENAEFEAHTGIGANKTGTHLVISVLRANWDKDKLDNLRKELERFIIDPEKRFSVYLRSADIIDKKTRSLAFDGFINNRLFEKIDDKTLAVHSEIVDKGQTVFTEIRHHGIPILTYKTVNPYPLLTNAKIQIHYLNPGAKTSFKNITGYTSSEYGSIMMFLNGFRVMPYGEPKDDWLGLNMRKAQGTARNLGSREVFGRVEVTDNKQVIVPVTSREGVENNQGFLQLSGYDLGNSKRGFIHTAFLALEAYVVNGLDWDRVEPKDSSFSYKNTLNAMLASVELIGKRNDLFELKIDDGEIRKIARSKIEEYEGFVEKLKEKVADKQVYDLSPTEKRQVKKFVERVDTSLRAAAASTDEFKKSATTERKRRLFLEAQSKPDSIKNKELVHHMRLLSDKIDFELNEAMRTIQKHSASNLIHSEITSRIQSALFNNEKLSKLAGVVALADFDMMSDSITEDVFSYVEQYVSGLIESGSTSGIKISFSNAADIQFPLSFSPIEVTMLVDNVIENASRAGAKNMSISVAEVGRYVDLAFENDGNKLSTEFPSGDLFLPGITTTRGSGIGLAQVSRIANSLDAIATISNLERSGVSLKIRWAK